MIKIIKGKKPIPKEDDCGCGKRVKKNERKKIPFKKTIKRK